VLPDRKLTSLAHHDYKPTRFELDPALKAEINRRWGAYMPKVRLRA